MDQDAIVTDQTRRTDQQLLVDLRAGKANAYEQLVRQHAPRMLAVAKRFLGQEADAHDAVQDAFCSVFRCLDSFKGDASLSTWLHTVVVRASLMKLRTRRRRPEQPIEDLLPQFHADGHRVRPGAAWHEDAVHHAELNEGKQLIRRCIDKLPESYRTVLLVRDIEECSTEEAARLLGVSPNVVKVRLHRARQALRTLLDPYMSGGAL